jgi:CelD/BcsL family acetyltransferase involved in cellulose biosynthesis
VLRLPDTADAYLASLGKATRKNFKYHGNRLKRNYPELAFRVFIDGDIPSAYVRDIIELNRARMMTKNKSSEIDDEETARLTRLVRESGLVSVMILDGKVVAGTVCSRVGANYFMHINAHDPAYDDARLGKLCCYMTICDCIERGGKEFHFMWGRFEYKYLLLGVQQDYDELIVYRSRASMLRNGRTALRTAYQGYSREWKFRLLDMANRPDESSAFSRAAARSLNFIRSVKQSGFRKAV